MTALRTTARGLAALTAAVAVAAPLAVPASAAIPAKEPITQAERPDVVAHRGASAYRPEHTLAAYELAVAQGADVIEPDLVSTKDGVLVDRHENDITGTTDVSERPEFADRKTTKTVDGVEITGWFTEDFTLAELKTLRAKERLPEARPGSAAYDGMYQVPTFEEDLKLREELSAKYGREIGIIPEIKHPSYFDGIGLSQEEEVIELLEEHGLNHADGRAVVQSFEFSNLAEMNTRLGLQADTAYLLWYEGSGYDAVLSGDTARDYAYFSTPAGAAEAAFNGIDIYGPELRQVIALNQDGSLGAPTGLVEVAHDAGLTVVPYTFRAENQSLPLQFRSSENPVEHGDLAAYITEVLDAGVDGFFTDFPDVGVAARDAWLAEKPAEQPSEQPSDGSHAVPGKVQTGDAAAWLPAGLAAVAAGVLVALRRRLTAAR